MRGSESLEFFGFLPNAVNSKPRLGELSQAFPCSGMGQNFFCSEEGLKVCDAAHFTSGVIKQIRSGDFIFKLLVQQLAANMVWEWP